MTEIDGVDDENTEAEDLQDNDDYDDGVDPTKGKGLLKFGILAAFVAVILYVFFFAGKEKKEIAPEKQEIVKEEDTDRVASSTKETNQNVSFDEINTFKDQFDTKPKNTTAPKLEEFESLFYEPDVPEIPELDVKMADNTLNLPDLSEIEQKIKEQRAKEEEARRLREAEEKKRQEMEAERIAAEAAAKAAAEAIAREQAQQGVMADLPALPTLENSNQEVNGSVITDGGGMQPAETPMLPTDTPRVPVGIIESPAEMPNVAGNNATDGAPLPPVGIIETPTEIVAPPMVEMPTIGGVQNTVNPVTAPTGEAGGLIANINTVNQEAQNARRQQVLESRRQVESILMSGGSTTNKEEDRGIVLRNADTITSLPSITTDFSASRIDDLSTTILQGKIIHVVLETALNTDLPGTLRAIVSRDVYAEMGDNILIPKGSRMIGTYAAQVQRGQSRIAISWTRILRPDGVSINIDAQAADQFGRAGIVGDINNRYKEIIANSLLTSLLSVGTVVMGELLTDSGGIVETTDDNGNRLNSGMASDYALQQTASDLVSNTQQMLQGIINVNPTISIPQGTKITVFVNQDLRIPPVDTLG